MKRLMMILGFALCATAQADVLTVPESGTEATPAEMAALPRRGTPMQTVSDRYGEPQRVSGPVGDPPITRWDYQDFSVFFEHDLVISSVIPGKPAPIYHKDELRPGTASY